LTFTRQGQQLKANTRYVAGWICAIVCVAILFDMPKIVQAYYILNGSEYVINGTVTHNTNNTKWMYMSYNDSEDPNNFIWVVDSAKIVNDKFTFRGRTDYPTQTYLSTDKESVIYRTKEKTAVLYTAPRNEISCVINLEHPFDSIKVYNSPTDNDLRYMIVRLNPIEKRRDKLWLQMKSVENTGDTVLLSKLRKEFYQINIELTGEILNASLSLGKTSAVVFDNYVSILFNNEYLNIEQYKQIETRFNEVPFYIKDCKSGKRLAKMIKQHKTYSNEKN